MTEAWLPVPDYEGMYEVSDHGRVRSLDRMVPHSKGGLRKCGGRILRPKRNQCGGYLEVTLCSNGPRRSVQIHRIVMHAFVGPRPTGLVTRHRNGNTADARLINLVYGTPSENQRDRVRHGRSAEANKTECPSGHPYSGDNLYVHRNKRACRICKRDNLRAYRARKRQVAA